MADKLRVALIGAGGISAAHLRVIEGEAERVELVAIVDIDEARANMVAERAGIPHIYTDYAVMLAAEKPDLVNIVSPPAVHRDQIIASLEAGAWVYCEKPLCRSLAEFDEISAAEARTGNYASTVFQWRFGSAGKYIKKLIETEALGKPLVGVCNTMWYRTQAYYDVPWRGKFETEVGGPTMTLGIHLTDLFLWLMGGRWEEVRAMIATLDHDIEVEDIATALVRFESGMLGTITNSALSPRQESYLRLDFQQATLECSALYRYTNENWRFSLPDGVENAAAQAVWDALSEDFQGSHSQQYGELLDSMAANERPFVSGDEARRILEFSASLYRSAMTGQPVRRGDISPDDPFYYAMNGAVQKAN